MNNSEDRIQKYKQFQGGEGENKTEARGIVFKHRPISYLKEKRHMDSDKELTRGLDWTLQLIKDKCIESEEFKQDFINFLQKYKTINPVRKKEIQCWVKNQ